MLSASGVDWPYLLKKPKTGFENEVSAIKFIAAIKNHTCGNRNVAATLCANAKIVGSEACQAQL